MTADARQLGGLDHANVTKLPLCGVCVALARSESGVGGLRLVIRLTDR